jgi:hypothetical protein
MFTLPRADRTPRCRTGCYKVWQVIPAYFNFAEFTLTEKDAKEYKYSKSTKQRVHKWKDIKVKLYI